MNPSTPSRPSCRALIVGGGVAAVEAVLALRELAGDRVRSTLLAPDPEFVYRPLRVREPFGYSKARTYPIRDIARDIGAELIPDAFKRLDANRSVVETEGGVELEYDALLLAIGARLSPAFSHGLTIDDRHLDEQLHGLVQDVEGGYVRSIAFIAPSPMPWPLPLYELALMTAGRAYDMGTELSVTIVTPEDAPLAMFGPAASQAVCELLESRCIDAILSIAATSPSPAESRSNPATGPYA